MRPFTLAVVAMALTTIKIDPTTADPLSALNSQGLMLLLTNEVVAKRLMLSTQKTVAAINRPG